MSHEPGSESSVPFHTRMESLARAGAATVAAAYVFGFLIVSLHHSRYGIPPLNPLKPRVLSAGTTFLLLTAIAVLLSLRWFKLLGWSRPEVGPPFRSVEQQHEFYLTVVAAVWFFLPAYGTATLLTVLFQQVSGVTGWKELVPTGFLLAGVASAYPMSKTFSKAPRLWTTLAICIFIGTVWSSAKWADRGPFLLSLWFFGVGLATAFLVRGIRQMPFSSYPWEDHLPVALAALLVYSTALYSGIKPEFGGGAPTTVTLYVNNTSTLPMINTPATEAAWIDEASDGIYIVDPSDSSAALFLPRALVSGVRFKSNISIKAPQANPVAGR